MGVDYAIGKALPRLEDERFLRGRGRFTDDLVPRDALRVAFLRSPHAHARIAALATARAAALPGVVAILTAAELAADGVRPLPAFTAITDAEGRPHREPPRPAIAIDRVRHVGEIVAMAVARTQAAALDALEAIETAYEPLPAPVTASAALAADAPQLHEDVPGNLMCDWRAGDAEAVARAFAGAARLVRLEQNFNRIVSAYLEPRVATAWQDRAAGQTVLRLSSQGSHILHRFLAERVLGWEPASLRVITPDVGGGFGPKFSLYPEVALLPWAARRLDACLHWAGDRSEHFLMDNHARDLEAALTLALDGEGRFLAVGVEAAANFGAYVSMFAPTVVTTGMAKVLTGLYAIPAAAIRMRCAFATTVPVDAFRGAGKPETLALLERAIDRAGVELGIAPAELRRRNLIRAAEPPYTTPLGYRRDGGDYAALLDRTLALAEPDGFEDRRRASAAGGLVRGRGLACYCHPSGGVGDEDARVAIDPAGLVRAYAGTQSQGQGHETVFAQIVASVLEIPIDRVELVQGDTARVGRGGGTGGSSSTIIGGTTLHRASGILRERALERAAERLEAALADLRYADGRFEVVGTDRAIGLFELAATGPALDGRAPFEAQIESVAAGVLACEVELDPETGAVRVDRLVTAIDIGTVVNPLLVDGQMHGGLVAGLGQALLEDAVHDPATGQLIAASFMDYALPRADDIARLIAIDTSQGTPSPGNFLGIRGVGELPTNGAPAAIANAVLDALAPYGIRHLPTPLTPERIWRAIRDCGPTGAAA